MIVLIGSKDASRKLLKDIIRYQDTIVYDCTNSDKYEGLNVQHKNAFVAARKLYDENASYEVFTTARTKDEAIENFFTGIDFKNEAASVLDSFIRNNGRINHIIIIRQMAYDVMKQMWKNFFNRYLEGEDRNIFLLWEEIKEDYQNALSWIPDDKTIKWAKRAYDNIESSIQNRRRDGKKSDSLRWEDEDKEEKDHKISRKVSVSGKDVDLDEFERELAEKEVTFARMRPTIYENVEKYFPELFPKQTDQLLDAIKKQKKKDKKRAKKLKEEKSFYSDKPNFPKLNPGVKSKDGVTGMLGGWGKKK